MNERLSQYWRDLKEYFGKFSTQKKILIGSLAGLVVVAGIAITVAFSQDPQQVLYSGLQNEDAKAVAKKLGELNIPYNITEDHSTVSVPASLVHRARMELAKDGLPGQDVVGFEKFDGSTLGMSTYVQRIQYIRAMQGELTRSIQRISAVKTARVHISVPPKKSFMEEEDPPKASVILELKQGQTLSKAETVGVAHLVASAVEGLKVNQITIVDTKGNFLHRPEDGSSQSALTGALLEQQKGLEVEYERRIEDILTPVIGLGKVRAKVTVEIDPSRSNTTEETFEGDKAVPRSIVKNDEQVTGQRPNPIGIPGSRSNLPGTEVNNPGIPMATNNTEKNTSTTNFAIPRKVQVVDKPSGGIKRLTVAVLVDGHYAKAQGADKETFSPRTEDELKRIQEMVGNAVGYDAQRRDSISVSSLPFQTEIIAPEEEAPTSPWDLKELQKHGVRNGLIVLTILFFFFLVMRPFLKWLTQSELGGSRKNLSVVPEMLPKTLSEVEALVQAEKLADKEESERKIRELTKASEEAQSQLVALTKANEEAQQSENPEKQEGEDLKNKILELLNNSPKKGFRVIQDWLEQEDNIPIPLVAEG